MEAKSKALWAITDELQEVGALIGDNGGELTPKLEERLDALGGELTEKVERIALYIRESELEAEKAKAEKDRLHWIQKHHATKAESLKKYAMNCMTSAGEYAVETHRARVRVQKNSKVSVRWTRSPHELPEGYRRTTIAPDLTAVHEDLDAGATPPEGFEIVQDYHLRIS